MAVRKKTKKGRKKATAKSPKKTKRAKLPTAKRTHKASSPEGGRPEIEFPPDCINAIALLSQIGCTIEEVALVLCVSKSTLERRIAEDGHPAQEAYKGGVANRRVRLRAAQFKNALEGNATMQKFLGVNELGQREFVRVEREGEGPEPDAAAEGDYSDLLIAKIEEATRGARELTVTAPGGR